MVEESTSRVVDPVESLWVKVFTFHCLDDLVVEEPTSSVEDPV